MDESSLVEVLGEGKKRDQRDINAAIKQWLKTDRIPNPYKFTPTMENPICTAPGRATAKFEKAYGVLLTGTGVTGAPMQQVRWCDWDWFLDEAEARREAYCRIWQQTKACYAWLDASSLEEPTIADLHQHDEMEIAVPGGVLKLYRVPVRESLFGRYFQWKVVVDKDAAIALHRETLFSVYSTMGFVAEVLPEPSLCATSQKVPDVKSQKWDDCPWTGQPIIGYASWIVSERGSIDRKWFPSRGEALLARTQVIDFLRSREEWQRQQQELEVARFLYQEALRVFREQYDRKDYRFFEEEGIVAVEMEYTDTPPGKLDAEEAIDWFLTEADRIAAVTISLQQVLDTERARRLVPWKDGALAMLRDCLAVTSPTCPLCGNEYLTEQIIEDLVVFGVVETGCCGSHGLSADPKRMADGQTTIPEIVTRLDRWASRLRNSDDATAMKLFVPWERFAHRTVEIGRVEIGQNLLVRFLARWYNACYWDLVIVLSESILLSLPLQTSGAAFLDTFTPCEKSLVEWWRGKLATEVAEGRAVWLRLEWRGERHGWGASRQKSGVKTVFRVGSPRPEGYDPGREYYCRIISTPPNVQRPGFVFHIVQPDLEATE